MLLLTSTSDKLQVITGSACTIDVHASWMDNVAGAVAPGRTNTNITTATTTDVVGSPAAGTQRNIKTLHVRNRGAASCDVTVQHTDGTIVSQLWKTALLPGLTLQYIDEIGFVVMAGTVGGASGIPPQGRLTLQSAAPVMTSTQSAKTTIFYSPYIGNSIPLYDGTSFVTTAFTELSAATADATKSPAAIGPNKNNDWFVWSDAGVARLGHGPDWSTDTLRSAGTDLMRVNGIWLNNVAITNGPAALRGTYVGTTRSNGSSQLDWKLGSSAVGGGIAFLYVWNAYNRRPVNTFVNDATASWPDGGGAWHSFNGSGNNSIYYIHGLSEDGVAAHFRSLATNPSGNCAIGISIDAIARPSAGAFGYGSSVAGQNLLLFANYLGNPGLGIHFLQAMEWSQAATATFYGVVGDGNDRSALSATIFM